MPTERVMIVDCDMITPYGMGVEACWKGLISGETAIKKINRFSTKHFKSENAAVISTLNSDSSESLVMQMLMSLFKKQCFNVPKEAALLLATTTGEIDILEKNVLSGNPDAINSKLDHLLDKTSKLSAIKGPGMIVSAACSSSSIAIAKAAEMIAYGECDCALVVACDCVSEFVFSGFSTINALGREKAKPFDKQRDGLSLGEAAGFTLLMSESRAIKEKRPLMAEILGWGMSCDANHITGPSRDGAGLSLAIQRALRCSNINPEEVGCISAHGTGTVYNDSMEIRAFKSVFSKHNVPIYSIKGGIGHTLGAAGLIETIVAMWSLKEKVVPPTINLQEADEEAVGWVSAESRTFDSHTTLSTNSGFGGINAALLLKGFYG